MWHIFPTDCITVEQALLVIDDATCHNFEFKVEKGQIWFREIE